MVVPIIFLKERLEEQQTIRKRGREKIGQLDWRRGLILVIAVVIWGATGCVSGNSPSAQNLAYDPDPDVLVVYADWQTMPVLTPDMSCFVLPDLRVWGDGRVVRVTQKDEKREVEVGYLSPDQVRQLLAFLREQGALVPWQQFEAPNPNAIRFHLNVQLQLGSLKNMANQPPTFYPQLLAFVNAQVKPLVPQQGFLVAKAGYAPPDHVQEWPDRFKLSLSQASEAGLWISGDVLDLLWADANNSRSPHAFRQDGEVYTLALEIPGIGPKEPPENCWGERN